MTTQRPQRPPQNVSVHNLESLADPGWYSHSLSLDKNNRLITTSGIIAQRKDGTFPPTLAEQIPTILSNVEAALHGAGATRRDIVQMRFYVVGWEMSTAGDVMGPLIKWLDGLKPATTLVPVTALAFPEAKIEIETIAAITGSARPWNSLDSHITNNTTTALSHAPPPIEIDVIVVGGGFSGMSAAYDLKKAGIKSIVLEARHRIGGRSWSTKLKSGPGYVDLGATWINNKTQPAVYALAQEFGLETYAQYLDGVDVYEGVDGKPVKVQDSMANPNTGLELRAGKFQELMGHVVRQSDAWDIRSFDQLKPEEDVSLAQWCRNQDFWDDESVRVQARNLTAALVGGDPENVGVHYLFDYIKSGGGLASLVADDENGAQYLKVKGGTSTITESIAAALEPGSVKLHSPVNSINQYGDKVLVTTTSGQIYKASKIILANPTNTYEKISFSPPLPAVKRSIVSRSTAGTYAKVILTYAQPWWREAGLVGKFTSMKGPICFSWELCDPAADSWNLALFITGPVAKAWSKLPSDLAREDAVIEHLAHLAGSATGDSAIADKAKDVIEVHMVDWNKEEWLWGAPTSYMGPNTLRQYGTTMRNPFKNVHFAGGEYAFEWKGYLEGAVRSGQRAAKEVLDAIKY